VRERVVETEAPQAVRDEVDAITREIVRLDREMWAERLHGPRGQERTVVHGHGFRLRELAAAATRVRGLEGRTGTTPPSTSRRTSFGASAPGGLSASEIVELRQRLMAMRIQAPGRSLAATPPSPTPTRRPARRGRPPIRPALRPPDPATAAAAPARRPPRKITEFLDRHIEAKHRSSTANHYQPSRLSGPPWSNCALSTPAPDVASAC
jgi:hypothetical protein